MKHFFIYIIFALSFISCTQGTKTEEEITQPALETKQLDKISKNWYEIRLNNNNWVIFQPCDGLISEVVLKKEGESDYLYFSYGQEAIRYIINSVMEKDDSSFVITTTADYNDSTHADFIFKKENGLNTWSVKYSYRDTLIKAFFIETKDTAKYSKVIQPCRECFDEKDCQEDQKQHKKQTLNKN